MKAFTPPPSAAAAQLEQDGFLHVEGVIDPVTIDTLLLRAHATLFRESADARARTRSTGSMCHVFDNPEFADIVAYPALTGLLRDLGASDPRFTGGFLISKPAGGPPLFWHQDWWGWTEAESYAARAQQWFAMIYLTDTSVENGCLRVIPGSHRRDHPLHHLEAAHSAALQAVSNPADPAYGAHPDEVAVPVKAGDVIIGDARLIHGAYSNRTTAERPLLTLWYMPHWSTMSPPMQARAMEGYLRRDDIETSAARPMTPLAWPTALRDRIAAVLPTLDGETTPIAWQRTPDTTRFAA